ncbi:MauE/DoxX family redox-associated membrane protein [Flindersiella endophytica]
MSYLLLASRVMLAAVFVVALAGKVRSRTAYADFRESVVDWRVLPRRWSVVAAAGTVAGEAAVLLLLALPWRTATTIGFVVGAALLAAFTTGIALALRLGRTATCRCFGASTTKLSAAHLVRNTILIGLCLGGAAGATVADGLERLSWPGVVLALSVAGVGALFVVRFDDLAAVAR